MIKDISILGCGWLGKPLAVKLIENGYSVKGSVTKRDKFSDLSDLGIDPYHINLSPGINLDYHQEFFDSSILMICLPHHDSDDFWNFFTSQIETIINLIHSSPIQQVFFFSSKKVYSLNNNVVNESQELRPKNIVGKTLLNAERILQKQVDFSTTVVRLADIMDETKLMSLWPIPKKKNSHKAIINSPEFDFIHLEDFLNIITLLVKNRLKKNEIFNVCSSKSIKKVDLLRRIAWKKGLETPSLKNQEKPSYVLMNNKKIMQFLDYKCIYEDPFKRKI